MLESARSTLAAGLVFQFFLALVFLFTFNFMLLAFTLLAAGIVACSAVTGKSDQKIKNMQMAFGGISSSSEDLGC